MEEIKYEPNSSNISCKSPVTDLLFMGPAIFLYSDKNFDSIVGQVHLI